MRGADSGMWANICALPAFWVGLLYDEEALEEAASIASDLLAEDVMATRLSVAKDGFRGGLAHITSTIWHHVWSQSRVRVCVDAAFLTVVVAMNLGSCRLSGIVWTARKHQRKCCWTRCKVNGEGCLPDFHS